VKNGVPDCRHRRANGCVVCVVARPLRELGLDEQAMILRAIEEGRFLPVGADKEAASHFQLVAGTNRDLVSAVAEGRVRDDLLARLNLWTFSLPGLAERREGIEPNLAYELGTLGSARRHSRHLQ
jgi:sigma54-dependent transcription regulator